jgi:hypothetical protein
MILGQALEMAVALVGATDRDALLEVPCTEATRHQVAWTVVLDPQASCG